MKSNILSLFAGLCIWAGLLTSPVALYAQEDMPQHTNNELVGNALVNKPTFSLFQQMMQATGWDRELMKQEDEEYRNLYMTGTFGSFQHPALGQTLYAPEHRYYGYTVFAEKNTVFETLLGKTVDAISLQDLTSYLATHYEGKTDEDYTSEEHVLNRFVSYHLLPVKLPEDKLVIHFNELWYNLVDKVLGVVPVMEYYETMGEGRRLMKMSESKDSEGVRINRFMKTDRQTGAEIPDSGVEGIAIDKEDSENASYLNGYLYALDDLLVYSQDVRSRLGNERMRHDAAALFPELANNDMRRRNEYNSNWLIPNEYQYFENMTVSERTRATYLSGYLGDNSCWANYQGDEMDIMGEYDITIKLPAVPESGTYELRLGFTPNDMRGMAQAYVGADKENLQPCGLPMDLRVGFYGQSALTADPAGWTVDIEDDETVNQLNDIRMREKGYMKGINSHYIFGHPSTLRNHLYYSDKAICLRRIIGQFHMEPGETYYLRLKSCLRNPDLEFHFDFIELVPEKVYNNTAEPEDWW